MISIRLTYLINAFPLEWRYLKDQQETEEMKVALNYWVERKPYFDPLCSLQVRAIWPVISEEVVVDSPVHSDLDPFLAPRWTMDASFWPTKSAKDYFSDKVNKFIDHLKMNYCNKQILGDIIRDTYDSGKKMLFLSHLRDKPICIFQLR